ncbi:MAG: hypothetical protein AAF492_26960 [Verrucomicrobiota bacterium]
MASLDGRFGEEDVHLEQIHDAGHCLRSHQKNRLERVVDEFETQFPQFFPVLYTAVVPDQCRPRELAAWLLNRGKVIARDELRNNENGFLFLFDLNRKIVGLTAGYYAEKIVNEEDQIELLRKPVPFLMAGDFGLAMEQCVLELGRVLRRKHRLLR